MEVNELKRNGKEQIETEYNKYFVKTNGTNSKELQRNRTERNISDIL